MTDALERMRGGLVVSVQAAPGSPLRAPEHLAALARAVEAGGAAGIRTEGLDAIAAIRAAVAVPVIGLVKRGLPGSEVYITPTLEDARAVAGAGADLVAVDATERVRPGAMTGPELVATLAAELPGRVLADVHDVRTGRAAAAAGAAAVATTLSGYVGAEPAGGAAEPDIALVAELAGALDCPVLAEGRYATPGQVRAAFAAGAFAVVVGTAIADPAALTRVLAAAAPAGADGSGG